MDVPEHFLRAILDAPGDEANRLVLADWLEENGRPRQALMLRKGGGDWYVRGGQKNGTSELLWVEWVRRWPPLHEYCFPHTLCRFRLTWEVACAGRGECCATGMYPFRGEFWCHACIPREHNPYYWPSVF